MLSMESLRNNGKISRTVSEIDLRPNRVHAKGLRSGNRITLDELIFKSPSVHMTPKRKRKRLKGERDDDSISLQSVDITMPEEPRRKRRSSLTRMPSLTNLLSPIKPVKKVGQALTRSLSLKSLGSLKRGFDKSSVSDDHNASINSHIASYKKPQPSTPKRRASTFWCETVGDSAKRKLSAQQMERQEAIYELLRSEEDLVEDLKMVQMTYHDSMMKLGLLSSEDLQKVFGPIHKLIPLHEEIYNTLKAQRLTDGTTDTIGDALIAWLPKLDTYIPYCSNQVYAKALLDVKKQDPQIEDFLSRCQESPFSRKLDLWSFLDVPRSRLVKYPLLFRNILKLTSFDHPDKKLLEDAIKLVNSVIHEVDTQTGISKCHFTRSMLEYLDDKQKSDLIDNSEFIACDGVLKNSRGTKLYVFLFEKILVLARPATRGHQLKYQVYRQPIPVSRLDVEDLEDGQKKPGSFRSAFSQNHTGRNMIRVTDGTSDKGSSHTLQANDEHDKRQWLQALQSVVTRPSVQGVE